MKCLDGHELITVLIFFESIPNLNIDISKVVQIGIDVLDGDELICKSKKWKIII